jgi:Tol biopolymer transport system component
MRTLLLALALTVAFATAASGATSTGRSKGIRSGTDGEIAFIKGFMRPCPHQAAARCGDSQIFTIKPDGTDLRQMTQGSRKTGPFSLAPNGRSLLYTVPLKGKVEPAKCGRRPSQTSCGHRYSGRNAILEASADGSHVTIISPPCTGRCLGDDNPTYSADGKQIAFARAFGPIVNKHASVVAIFTMNADGSHLTQLTEKKTPTSTEDHDPQWSPNGKKIAFVRLNTTATPRNAGAIEVMNADGSHVQRLTPFRLDAGDPRWSPSGKRLLFNDHGDGSGESDQGPDANLFTMNADGSHLTQITDLHYTHGSTSAYAQAWSPDGTQILYLRITAKPGAFGASMASGLAIINTRGKLIRQLPRRDAGSAAWIK